MSSRFFCKECKKYYDELIPPKVVGKCDDDCSLLEKIHVSRGELKKEFEKYSKETEKVIDYLKYYSTSYFDVSGYDDEILIFSNILIKLRDNIKNDHVFLKKALNLCCKQNMGNF